MSEEKKMSSPSKKEDKTIITEKERYKGKLDKARNKARAAAGKPEPKKRDTKPSPTRSRTNTTKHSIM